MRSEGAHAARKGRTREFSALPPVCRVRLSLRCARLSAADRSPNEARHRRTRLLPLAHPVSRRGRVHFMWTIVRSFGGPASVRRGRDGRTQRLARAPHESAECAARPGKHLSRQRLGRSCAYVRHPHRGTPSTHMGYSGYSQGVHRVLTGGAPSTHRGTHRGCVRSCASERHAASRA